MKFSLTKNHRKERTALYSALSAVKILRFGLLGFLDFVLLLGALFMLSH